MSEKKPNKKLLILLIFSIIVTGILGVMFGATVEKYTIKEKEYQKRLTSNEQYMKMQEREILELTKKIAYMKKEAKNLKTNDDLLKRDIYLYIKTKYRRVPKVVSKTIAQSIVKVSKDENVSPALIVGIMEIESQFNPMARNEKSKAIGLMQIMPSWTQKLNLTSVYDLYDIDINIQSGVKILKIHISEDGKGDISKGLYFYVGKDSTYAGRVFQAAGKFVIFRTTIDSEENSINKKKGESMNANKPAKRSN